MRTAGRWAILSAAIALGGLGCADIVAEEYAGPLPQAAEAGALDTDGCVAAARQWLDTLPPAKREIARAIMRQSNPRAAALRQAINEKKAQLAGVNFNRDVAPETLPRLGLELQQLRRDLRSELLRTHFRLSRDAYIILPPLPKDAVCLPLPPAGKE